MRGRGIDTPRLQIFFSQNFSANGCSLKSSRLECQAWSCGVVVITSALHAEGPQFDPGRDQIFFVQAISRRTLQVSELMLDCVYYLQIVIYSAQFCLPCHITNTIDVSARHYPAVLSHTHMVRDSYIVPILTGTGPPV